MTEHDTQPPRGDEMHAILAAAKAHVLREATRSRSSARRYRRRTFGAIAIGAIALGGATTAAATGLFGGIEASDTRTATFDLGPAPAGSTFVYVTLDAVCQPSARYEVDLDHARNPASMICGEDDDGRPGQLGYEFELVSGGPDHSVTVTTTVERAYTLRAHYRTGRTQNQQLNDRMKELEDQRAENSRTVERTDKIPSTDPYHHPAAWPDPYYVNENGMTIGTFDRDTTPFDQWPDLVPVEGPKGQESFTYSGKRGYLVLAGDDAVRYSDWLVETGQSDPVKPGRWTKRYLVYLEEDGTTVIARRYAGSSKS